MDNILGLIRSTNHMFFEVWGEEHEIDGRKMTVNVDGDALEKLNARLGTGRTGNHGMSGAQIMYYAKAQDFDKLPKTGDRQKFDGRMCVVEDVRDDEGIVRVVLSQIRG
ncbi:hypothetical protein ACH6CV_14480 [Bacillota bacterium Meth-B3]